MRDVDLEQRRSQAHRQPGPVQEGLVVVQTEPARHGRGVRLLTGAHHTALQHPARLDLSEQAVERPQRLLDPIPAHRGGPAAPAVQHAAIAQPSQRLPGGVAAHVVFTAQVVLARELHGELT